MPFLPNDSNTDVMTGLTPSLDLVSFGNSTMLFYHHHKYTIALSAARLAVSKHYLCAAITMLVYDHILTFADEVEHIWKRLRSVVSCLFIINRYYTLIGVMTVFFGSRGHEACVRFVSFEKWGIAIPLFIIPGIVLTLRVYALYDRNKYIALYLGLLLLGTICIGIWEVSYPGGGSLHLHLQQIEELRGCSFLPSLHLGSRAAAYLGANLFFDVSVFSLTMVKTLQSTTGHCTSLKDFNRFKDKFYSRIRGAFKTKPKISIIQTDGCTSDDMHSDDPENPQMLNGFPGGSNFPLRLLPPHPLDLDRLSPPIPLNSPLPSCSSSPVSAFESPLIRETPTPDMEEQRRLQSTPRLGLFRKLARDGAIYFFVISSSICVWLFMVIFAPWQLKWMNALPTLWQPDSHFDQSNDNQYSNRIGTGSWTRI